MLDVNLDSAFHLLRGAAPLLRARGGGSVVLVSSINGERGKFGQANYAASKAGLIGLARSAARELGRFGVRVNVVAPGLVRHRDDRRAGRGARRAARSRETRARARRASPRTWPAPSSSCAADLARHVTGQVLRVDGGQLMA